MDAMPDIQWQKAKIDHIHSPFLDRLKTLYADMDQKYQEAADYYGFKCTGCEDNCCFTRFYHYTLLEYLYLMRGYNTLDHSMRTALKERALDVCRKADAADDHGISVRLMCPLNLDGRCVLYPYRPMICRLHGIPHELQSPGHGIFNAPGCDVFTRQCREKERFKFDRTPFYVKMAGLEKELKQSVGRMQKIKMTVAQMIKSFRLSENIWGSPFTPKID